MQVVDSFWNWIVSCDLEATSYGLLLQFTEKTQRMLPSGKVHALQS